MPQPSSREQLGFGMVVALVMGNMIGSGVFMLPASLAAYGGLSIGGWLVSAAGATCLALVFARLTRLEPAAGGPYAFTRRAFGDLPGFLVAWGYWISVWCSSAALAVAGVGYLDPFFPTVVRTPALAAALAIGAVWVFTMLNIISVRRAGHVQVVTTIVKVAPLVLVGLGGLWHFSPEAFAVTASGPRDVAAGITSAATLTLFAFLGLECATIPAGAITNPERTIPRATIVGTLLTAGVYIVSTIGVMSLVPGSQLATTTAPFADAATTLFGPTAGKLVAFAAAVSCFGALNGWTLIVGQLPLAVARDGLFPPTFARVTASGTPATGMIIAGVITSLLVGFNFTRGLVDLFTFIILLSTLSTLVPYAFCSLAAFRLGRASITHGFRVVAGLAFTYALWAIGGAGQETVYWGFLLLMSGLPVFVWITRRA